MPMFNAAKYLPEALNSLRKQYYRNFEVIIVDDGSTDKSIEIAERFIKMDRRFKLIRQKNQYAGVARNTGLRSAIGDYVIFLDADDIFHRDMLQKLSRDVETHDVDIVTFNYCVFSKKYYKHEIKLKYAGCVKEPAAIRDDLFNIDPGIPWNKLYKMEFIKRTGLQFQDTINTNDVFFTRMSFALASKIYFSTHTLMSYRSGNANSVQGRHLKNPEAFYIAFEKIIDVLIERGLFEIYKKTTQKMIIDVCQWKLKEANTEEKFLLIFNYSKKLFEKVGLDTKDNVLAEVKEKQVVQAILCGDITNCVMGLYFSYKNQNFEGSNEYRIGKALAKVLPFLFR